MSAILFDLDGTLIDSLVGIHATASAVLTQRGHSPPDRPALQALVGAPLETIFATLVPSLDDAGSLTYANHYRELYWSVGVPHTPLFPGISDLLPQLTSIGASLAVVTTKRADVAGHILESLDISRHFQAVVGGDSTPHHKPHPAPALAAVKALSSNARTSTVVGDTTFDILMARAAGCRSIAVGWGYGPRESLVEAGAGSIVESVDQLRALLLADSR